MGEGAETLERRQGPAQGLLNRVLSEGPCEVVTSQLGRASWATVRGRARGGGSSLCRGPGQQRLARELVPGRRPPASACSVSGGPSPPPGQPSQQRLEFLMPLLAPSVACPLSALSRACQARAVRSGRRARWRGERGGQAGELAGTWPPSLTRAGGGRWPRRAGPEPAVEQARATCSAARDPCSWLRARPVS